MVEQDNMKAYIVNLNKIINSGNPKYLAYVCKEFTNAKKNNPVLSNIIESIILKEAKEPDSCYRILVDNDNGINLEALYDISNIQNIPDFIKRVDALSAQDVDFKELTSDDLIIEGMEIAEELAKEVEEIDKKVDIGDQKIDETAVEEVESKVENKTKNLLGKAAAGVGVVAIVKIAIAKVRSTISGSILKLKDKFKKKKEKTDINKDKKEKEDSKDNKQNDSGFIQKVDVDEEKAIANMKSKAQTQKSKIRQNDVNDDAFNDTSDDDFDDDNNDDDNNNDSDNTGIEDDEPDI